MNVVVIDYGMGNVFNVARALETIGCTVQLSADIRQIEAADAIVLPGVGAFTQAMNELNERGLVEPIRRLAVTRPLLGICLGMQLLLEQGEEGGENDGLGLIPGIVRKLEARRLPHVGWNTLSGGGDVYFVHSYYTDTSSEHVIATVEYEGRIVPAMIASGQVTGMQFHPEKSGEYGLDLLRQWKEGAACGYFRQSI